MNARHAARELALLTLFQLDKQGKRPSQAADLSVKEMVLISVRTLSEEARLLLENAAGELADVSRAILEVEMDHPNNLNANMDALLKPVPMPSTRETVDKIERCLQAAEYVAEALRIPELAALAKEEHVLAYSGQLIKILETHRAEIDDLINACSAEWRVDRMVLLDAWILRLAAAEMKYMDGVDISVSIDEAVELAKDFSTEESFKYINGVLGALAKQLASPAA